MSEHAPGSCPNCGVNASEVMPLVVKLRLQRDELLAALEAVEWGQLDSTDRRTICPCCYGSSKTQHFADCQLAAAIQAARGE